MKIIATHVNADFDGFAAMIGLLKMHPDARLLFPGAKESGLRHFLKETGMEVPEISLKEVDRIDHLLLVDASREDRLGPLGEYLHRQSPPSLIEIYDHHPAEQATLQAHRFHCYPYGSTTTIVVLELMQRQPVPSLNSLEASILLAGIYEDTASFVSSGTTPEDFRAALFLLEHGAEISLVNRLLTHRLEPGQADFFNAMVSHCERIKMEGHEVVLSVFSWPSFMQEAAYLVHRLMDLEPIDLFFALIWMDNRVHLIARSQVPDVDVGVIAAQLGGGGHRMAASAVLKGVTLIEAREKLLSVLYRSLPVRKRAADLMQSNIIFIESDRTLQEAAELMNSYRINALPIREKGRVVGTISRQIVDGALFHGLKENRVRDYMTTEMPLIDPETPVAEIFDQMVSHRSRFVLVGKDPENVQGIITRMDLLRYSYEGRPQALNLRKGRQSENLAPMLKKRLPESVYHLLEESGRVAEEIGVSVYLVGGMVRDLLLHRDNMDVDLVVEGDGIRFAEELEKRYSARMAAHKRFGTARLIFRDGFKIDVATARTESYHAPAALPRVHGGILRQDLYRRDFTINTLAIDLSPQRFGTLVDYFGGWDDLHQGVVRVLHSLSFVDDPTRALRAIRFATRFNFRISRDTQRLMQNAVESRILDRLSGKRFWSELCNILMEEHPIPALRMLHQYQLLSFIHPGIVLDSFLLDSLYQVQTVLAWYRLEFPAKQPPAWLLYFMALLEKLDRAERMEIAARFQLKAAVVEILKYYKSSMKDIYTRLKTASDPASIYFSLRDYPLEVLLYGMARFAEEDTKQKISSFLRDLQSVKLEIDGHDLLALGMKPGPELKEVLDQVLRARLEGRAPDRQTQLETARSLIETVTSKTGEGRFDL